MTHIKDRKRKIMKNILLDQNIKFIVIHCSDTQEDFTAIDIHKMHLNFGWDGIGYHKIICKNGNIENGRPEYWVGAHVKGINKNSLGICLIGKKRFSKSQFNSLKLILIDWKIKYPNTKILGHRNATETSKTCPNFDVEKWCDKNL